MFDKKQFLKDMGTRLAVKRKELNWSQQYAAEQCDISQQSISDAETGSSNLSSDTLYKICSGYGISADYLLAGEVADMDIIKLDQRVRKLSPEQFLHYQGMTGHFLAVAGVEDNEQQ